MTFVGHHLLFPPFCRRSFFSASNRAKRVRKAKRKKGREPFCVNSLIKKTSASIVPLHFGGKRYFIDFFFFLFPFAKQSKAGGAEKAALCGIRHSRGAAGTGGRSDGGAL